MIEIRITQSEPLLVCLHAMIWVRRLLLSDTVMLVYELYRKPMLKIQPATVVRSTMVYIYIYMKFTFSMLCILHNWRLASLMAGE